MAKREKEIPVKDIKRDGSLELMTPKEARRWRKTLKSLESGASTPKEKAHGE